MHSYDVIVLGCGGVGSAAAYHLVRRGMKVLAIDRYSSGHDRGSSHGQTRVIRQAYFEHPNYVPLLLRAYELWRGLEQESGVELLRQVGLLQVGPPEGHVVRGVLQSAARHGLTVEALEATDIYARFPGFRVPAESVGVFEPAAGYLWVERCVLAHLAAAGALGAERRFDCPVRQWQAERGAVSVVTDQGTFTANKLIIAGGPWAPQFLAALCMSLEIRRKHVYWFPATKHYYDQDGGCPTYLYELPHGVFYGIPQIHGSGVKVAEHSGGVSVEDPSADPRELDSADLARVEAFLAQHLPGVGSPMLRRSVCYYTMSPDEHFVVDRHPEHDNVFFAAGLSGHGFKFTSVLGEALADLAHTGDTSLPVGFLGLRRFQGAEQ